MSSNFLTPGRTVNSYIKYCKNLESCLLGGEGGKCVRKALSELWRAKDGSEGRTGDWDDGF
jgi:hypothetical protein